MWAERLRVSGVSESEFARALGVQAQAAEDTIWWRSIEAAFATGRPAPALSAEPIGIVGFLRVIAPLIDRGASYVRARMGTLNRDGSREVFDADVIEQQFRAGLERTLLRLISRTMVVELHVARVEGVLRGVTPEARFKHFVETLGDRERALEILARYPVLARQVAAAIDDWVRASLTFLARLCADWRDIAQRFNGSVEPGRLASVDTGLSDRHGGGHAVIRARFESGLRVIYKPRALSLDEHFQKLLSWLNDRGLDPAFRLLGVLDRGEYGWVECVGRASCTTADAVQRFFQRQGGYLALLYALDATDFHHENVLADGEHPMLVDLEALFHPRDIGSGGNAGASAGADAVAHSVLRVGLLPERVWASPSHEGFDISGLGAPGGQRSPDPVLQWEDAGTDTMRVVRRHVTLPAGLNRPMLGGAEVNALDHAAAVADGFTRTYQLLHRHRAALLAPDGPLAAFAGDEIRVIVRPTRIYARMLDESAHPDLQREAFDRERFFDRLWVGVDEHRWLARVVDSELRDLLNGDVPRFAGRPGSRHLRDSAGHRFDGLLREAPMASVRRRISGLSALDLERQRWFITASLAAMGGAAPHDAVASRTAPRTPARAAGTGLVELASRIGERLESIACRGAGNVAWMGISPHASGQWSLAPVGIDLYDGLPGIAFFLAHLGAATGAHRYHALARLALATTLAHLHDEDSRPESAGGFNGWGGVIYTLSHLGRLWKAPDLLVTADSLVPLIDEAVRRDEAFDILDGLAGAILALLALEAVAPSVQTRAALRACGERLLGHAAPMASGIGWPTVRALVPLAGMAHGNAGIALALSRLADATGDARYRRAAHAAIDYECTLFSAEAANWPDLRIRDEAAAADPKFMTAWCHGAPGIGLARLRSPTLDRDPRLMPDIEVAIGTVVAAGALDSQCLCHGELGNLELLVEGCQLPALAHRSADLTTRVEALLESLVHNGSVCGSPGRVEVPGLMTGLAGIGYGLLRLSDCRRFPSVLALDPPPHLTSAQHRPYGS